MGAIIETKRTNVNCIYKIDRYIRICFRLFFQRRKYCMEKKEKNKNKVVPILFHLLPKQFSDN